MILFDCRENMFRLLGTVALAASARAHAGHADQEPLEGPHKSLWYNTLPGDGGTQVTTLSKTQKHWGKPLTLLRPTLSSPASRLSAASPTNPAWPAKMFLTTSPSLAHHSIQAPHTGPVLDSVPAGSVKVAVGSISSTYSTSLQELPNTRLTQSPI